MLRAVEKNNEKIMIFQISLRELSLKIVLRWCYLVEKPFESKTASQRHVIESKSLNRTSIELHSIHTWYFRTDLVGLVVFVFWAVDVSAFKDIQSVLGRDFEMAIPKLEFSWLWRNFSLVLPYVLDRYLVGNSFWWHFIICIG